VAAAIQAVRASLGLSVAELARRSGIVGITLHRVLHSQRAMTVAQLAALAPVLGMTPSELLAQSERRSATRKR
jgi:transcriptional regulator with XRE-family HTH domain